MSIDERIAKLEEKVDNWQSNTLDYRVSLSKAIDEVKESNKDIMFAISKLPCDKREGTYMAITSQIKVMWAFLSAIVMVIVSEYVGWKKP